MTSLAISISAPSVPNRSVRSSRRRTRSIAALSRRRSPPAIASVGSLQGVTGKLKRRSRTFCQCGGYDSHLRWIRRVFAGNIDRMTRAIERCFPAGTRVSRPAGGFVLWVELPGPVDTRVLFGVAVKLGICFAPGDVFSASARCRHCLRLSCGYGWDERIEEGIETIGALA